MFSKTFGSPLTMLEWMGLEVGPQQLVPTVPCCRKSRKPHVGNQRPTNERTRKEKGYTSLNAQVTYTTYRPPERP
jgi:hypothetical protein